MFQSLPTLHRELTQKTTKPDIQISIGDGKATLSTERANDEESVVEEESINTLTARLILGKYEEPVICKLEPFNICYRFDKNGNMYPLRDRRPVRVIRIYK